MELELNKDVLGNKNKKYINWDEFFMGVALLASSRSKDPNTRVGACIVDKDNRILSIGYNGTPNGFSDDKFPWDRNGDTLDTKYAFVCHSELNAIINYKGSRKDLNDATLYVTLFPCNECSKIIIQAGIKNIIYLSDKYDGTTANTASKIMFKECGINYKQLKSSSKISFDFNPLNNVEISNE